MNYDNILDLGYASRFLSVGLTGAVFDNVVLFAGVEMTSIPPLAVKVLSAEASIVLMFIINEHWTFSEYRSGSTIEYLRRLVTSNVVRLGGLTVGLVALFVLHDRLGVWYLLANVIGIGLGFLVNYVTETVFTWQLQNA